MPMPRLQVDGPLHCSDHDNEGQYLLPLHDRFWIAEAIRHRRNHELH